ncbi:TetR/AcrR family transcriptional regulator [Vallitalea guaymasensis]|uniref:TetR/AcrR family transcriptional regulator n=1 Tax=Vallitalea guaymasensis TaxID=1185412 RepID=A0A8J8MDY9_9FIRM|nr:TetR/AcrR family transcriptional regulator [Vallitalea guaymasensis]QUH31063.1 TetR/AcrR family transcriptional regulator [Vallitalea guaymasensis]
MPKIVDTEAIRIEIIKKAFDVFVKKGYYKSSMTDITKSCNMKRTTIYHYFKNKDEIFEQTVLYVIETLENDIIDISNDDDMTLMKKIKYLTNKWDNEFSNNNILLLLVEMWFAIKREEGELFDRIKKRITLMNKSINKIVVQKAKYMVNSKRDKKQLIEYSMIMSILNQVSLEKGFLSESIISVISSF